MISSMTGFGKASIQKNGISAECEVKSVNSRYLEISLKLPKSLLNKELEIREIVRNKIKRGKLIVNLQLKFDGLDESKLFLNKENLKLAVEFLKQVKKTAKIKDDITLSHLLSFQNIFLGEDTDSREEEFELLKEAIEKALDELIVMRNQEGKELYIDISTRLKNIIEQVTGIETISRNSTIEFFEKIKERAKQIIANLVDYNERLELELALLVDKSDVTEECVRLKSHAKYFLDAMNNGSDVGRRLNFLCQEINREANTIGSKSLTTEISYATVTIKEEIERIREQIQNIE